MAWFKITNSDAIVLSNRLARMQRSFYSVTSDEEVKSRSFNQLAIKILSTNVYALNNDMFELVSSTATNGASSIKAWRVNSELSSIYTKALCIRVKYKKDIICSLKYNA